MDDCKHLQTEDITPWHGDVFDHPDYKYTCEKCGNVIEETEMTAQEMLFMRHQLALVKTLSIE